MTVAVLLSEPVADGLRRLFRVRASLPHLHAGCPTEVWDPRDPGVLLVVRRGPDGPLLLAANVTDEERWVVQKLATIPVYEFPVVGPDGSVHVEPFYTVMGFAPSRYGLAILGRASQKQVVNVAQRGGMCAVMVGHPPARLFGPRAT